MSYLFVYGTLQRGFKQHSLLKGYSKFVSSGYVYGKLYEVNGYPALVLRGKRRVFGEVYKIKRFKLNKLLKTLDDYEECSKKYKKPHEYKRVKMKLYVKNSKKINCWIYLYNLSVIGLTFIKESNYKLYKKA